jgi:hypothetical protein
MARPRKALDIQEAPIEVVQAEVEHTGVETWIPASKVAINTTVVCTDERQTVNGVEMARCFYK